MIDRTINTQMLYVSTNIQKFTKFKEMFIETQGQRKMIDLSRIPSADLAKESGFILQHHTDCCVFLGYLEPGWMLDFPSQTILRKLFRKFPVGFICHFIESLPFSWKTEIESLYYTNENSDGSSNFIDDGGIIQNQPHI